MKCLNNNRIRKFCMVMIIGLLVPVLSGCSNSTTYDVNEPLHIRSTVNLPIVRPVGLAKENVVIPYDAYVYDD